MGDGSPTLGLLLWGDTRKSLAGMEYCNLIIYTEDTNAWEQAIREQYSAYEQHTVALQGGHQITIRRKDNGALSIVVSVYPQNGKLMIQPGEEDEENLLEVLRGFPDLMRDRQRKTSSTRTNTLKASSTKDTTTNMEGRDKKQDEKEGTGNELQEIDSSAATAEACSDNTLLECANNSLTEITMGTKKLIVNLPPINSVDYSNHSMDKTKPETKQNPEKHSSPQSEPIARAAETNPAQHGQPIINELLCFIQYKMDTLPIKLIVDICQGFYSDEAVTSAKRILYEATEGVRKSCIRYKKYIGPDKLRNNLMDIVTVLQSLEIKDIPSFVVRDLANVPPLTSLNCDVIGLYREIEKLKDGFSVVKQCQENIATLSKQVELQRTPKSAPNDHDHSIIHSTPNHIPARETRDSATTMNIKMSMTKNTATLVHGSGRKRESVTPRGSNANLLDGSYVVIDSVPRSGSDSDTSEGESENEESITQATRATQQSSIADPIDSNSPTTQISNQSGQSNNTGSVSPLVSQAEEQTNHGKSQTAGNSKGGRTTQGSTDTETANNKPSIQSNRKTSQGKENSGTTPSKTEGTTRKDLKTLCAKGSTTYLKAAKQFVTIHNESTNRTVVGVLIRGLKPETGIAKVAIHVYRETGLTVRPEKMRNNRNDRYSSFFIRCNRQIRQSLMDEHIWPTGTAISPFFC